MAEIKEIGRVISQFKEKADPFVMRKEESTIEIYPEFAEGLFDIESNKYLQILFHFDRSNSYSLKVKWYYGDEKGVFACRSPERPAGIGLTTVELLERHENILRVRGLDALNDTPVFDIKPLVPHTDFGEDVKSITHEFAMQNPRAEFIPMIKNKELKSLFIQSGKLHGHYCPGLALGVMASVFGIHKLSELLSVPVKQLISASGEEHLFGVIESKSCFTDGIQFTSGCTFGNKYLSLNDTGEEAITFGFKKVKGLRLVVKSEYKEYLKKTKNDFFRLQESLSKKQDDPEFLKKYLRSAKEAALMLLEIPFEDVFEILTVEIRNIK